MAELAESLPKICQVQYRFLFSDLSAGKQTGSTELADPRL